MTVRLAFDVAGQGEPLLIVHGLFGSATNWRTLGRRFAEHFQIFTLDLRNHGRSPWADPMDYPSMAADLLAFMDDQGIAKADLMGHSMGGKACMALALLHPERVRRLVVVDIAPVSYSHDLSDYIDFMRAINLSAVGRRSDVDAQLKPHIPEAGIRAFLVQNLRQEADKSFSWRINLDALHRHMRAITGFPDFTTSCPASTLFLHGGRSHYLTDEYRPPIDRLFPHNDVQCLPEAGHWLHAEQPDELFSRVTRFLEAV